MVVYWEVEDGYMGKSRPQKTKIPDWEFDDCETEEEKQNLIDEYVDEDFKTNISYCITRIEE